MQSRPMSSLAKRLIDILGASIGLLLLSPVILVTALLVRVKLGSPIMFRQKRPGLHGDLFQLMKFRSMTDQSGSNGQLLSDEQRVTPVGKLIRRTSLDELPTLLNVLRGDLSLVGPRPLLPDYLPLYDSEQSRRHEVKPGVTGWAQVNGRNAISWEEKFQLDVWYVDNWSLWLDIKILFMTVAKVFKQEGINASDAKTPPRFMGTPRPANLPTDSNLQKAS